MVKKYKCNILGRDLNRYLIFEIPELIRVWITMDGKYRIIEKLKDEKWVVKQTKELQECNVYRKKEVIEISEY